jgi:hypothetical protein
MSAGIPREDLKARLQKVVAAGNIANVTLEDVLAAHQPKYTREDFKQLLNGGPDARANAGAVLDRWVQMIRAKQAQAPKSAEPAGVLPSHQELAPTLGLPKEAPLQPAQLEEKLTKLIALSEKAGVGLAQVVTLGSGQALTVESLRKLIQSDNIKAHTRASEIMEEWTATIRTQLQTLKELRGVTPKHVLPPRPTLTGGARWVPYEVDDEVRDVTLATHNVLRKKYGGMPPLKYNQQLEPGALEWAYSLAGRIPYVQEHCADLVVPGLGVAGENIGMDEFGGGGTGGFKVQWTPDHAKMVQKYEGEAQFYDLEKKTGKPGRNVKHYGHFTQLIWCETQFVAVGFAVVEVPIVRNRVATKYFTGRGVWVHRYYPGGNTEGQFAKNT